MAVILVSTPFSELLIDDITSLVSICSDKDITCYYPNWVDSHGYVGTNYLAKVAKSPTTNKSNKQILKVSQQALQNWESLILDKICKDDSSIHLVYGSPVDIITLYFWHMLLSGENEQTCCDKVNTLFQTIEDRLLIHLKHGCLHISVDPPIESEEEDFQPSILKTIVSANEAKLFAKAQAIVSQLCFKKYGYLNMMSFDKVERQAEEDQAYELASILIDRIPDIFCWQGDDC